MAELQDLIGLGGIFADGDWIESKDQDQQGGVRLIQLADIGDGAYRNRSSRYLTEAKAQELGCTFLTRGDLLVARMPDPLGRACIFPGDLRPSVTAVDVCIIRTGRCGPDHRWLMYFMNSPAFRSSVAELQSGSTRKRISRRNLASLALPIPPLAEQRRIVAAIEEHFSDLDAAVAALERVRGTLPRYRAAVLKAACEGRLVETEAEVARREGRPYQSAEELLDAASQLRRERTLKSTVDALALPALPTGWAYATWEQLAERVTVGHVGPMKHEYVREGIPFLRSQNVRENRFDSDGLLYITQGFHRRLKKSTLRPGDLVVVRSGSVGVTCVVPEGIGEANCADLVIIQRPVRIVPRYGAFYMNSAARRHVRSGQVGVALIHFNTASVASLPVAVPPLAEQHRIVAEVDRRLSLADAAERAVEVGLAKAKRLRQAILKRAFEGKLVPQDPNDEPASVLLERIRTAKAGSAHGDGRLQPKRLSHK